MDTKKEFSKRRKAINIILFIIACFMLSLFFLRTTLWTIIVILISAVLVAISMRLNRCPKCKHKIKNDNAQKCENCGCDLR